MKSFPPVTLAGIRADLAQGRSAADILRELRDRIAGRGDDAVWIYKPELTDLLASIPDNTALPLYGVPFAVKDNIDVAGWPTTAACPEFSYIAEKDAESVARLRAAGAVPMGKTNMDQFATGLVGVRSPYGIPRCVVDEDYISGGSSSGSAVAVAAGLCAFSLGTDTAGSGRVPAAFNGLAGLKPSIGLISTDGVVPACKSLDCVSIFAWSAAEAAEVLKSAGGAELPGRTPFPEKPRIGVPKREQLEFFGDAAYAELFEKAVLEAKRLGGEVVEFNYQPFADTARLLYAGPWVAERASAVGDFLATDHAGLDPTVTSIIRSAGKWTARDAFEASYQLEKLRKAAATEWVKMDLLLLPTAPSHYKVAEVLADPVALNSRLGTYTNFVNLLNLCAMAVPAGIVPGTERPFGVTFMAPAGRDTELAAIAQQFTDGQPFNPPLPPDAIQLAVVGAHLSGEPLHHQLTSREARLVSTTRTAADYRLFSLPNTTPAKPGLVRTPGFTGPGLEVEVYALTPAAFGSFTAEVPPPMGIGTVQLADGSSVKGFLCEPCALEGAADITVHGGWKAWRASLKTG
ncbi:MAG: allophanate hydrolase [Verrucomicrobiota bacterium]